MCEALCLKSNTMTPLLKKLEDKGFIKKEKDKADERSIVVTLTDAGEKLRDKALVVPESLARELSLTPEDASELYRILYKMLDEDKKKNDQ